MKAKTLSLIAGAVLAANAGFVQAAELDEATEIPENACPAAVSATEDENRQPVEVSYDVDGNTLSIFIEGIGLSDIKHFTFDGEVIDALIYEGRDNGSITIEEQQNNTLVLVSLPQEQRIVGGVFGVITQNGTSVSAEIPGELLDSSTRERGRGKRCKAYFRLDGFGSYGWVNLGKVRWPARKKKCERKARSYASRLRYNHFGISKQQYCNKFGSGKAPIYYDTQVSGRVYSRDGYVHSRLGVRCRCSGWSPY